MAPRVDAVAQSVRGSCVDRCLGRDVGGRLSADAAIAKARKVLGAEAFEKAWADGSAMSLEEALAYGAGEISLSE